MPLGPQCGDRGGKLRPFCPRADPYLCHCLSVLVGAGALRGQLARWPPCYDLPEQVQGGTEQHPLAPGLLEVHAARAPHVRPSACARGQRVCPETPEHSGCCRPNCAPQVHVLKRSPSVTDRGTHARHQRSPPTPCVGARGWPSGRSGTLPTAEPKGPTPGTGRRHGGHIWGLLPRKGVTTPLWTAGAPGWESGLAVQQGHSLWNAESRVWGAPGLTATATYDVPVCATWPPADSPLRKSRWPWRPPAEGRRRAHRARCCSTPASAAAGRQSQHGRGPRCPSPGPGRTGSPEQPTRPPLPTDPMAQGWLQTPCAW